MVLSSFDYPHPASTVTATVSLKPTCSARIVTWHANHGEKTTFFDVIVGIGPRDFTLDYVVNALYIIASNWSTSSDEMTVKRGGTTTWAGGPAAETGRLENGTIINRMHKNNADCLSLIKSPDLPE